MLESKLAYVSTEWYVDTDMTVLYLLAKEYKVQWIYLTSTRSPRMPLNIIKQYAENNNIDLCLIPANSKYLNLKNFITFLKLYRILYRNSFSLIYMVGSIHIYRIFFEFFLVNRALIVQGVHDVQFHSGIKGEFIVKLSYKWMFCSRRFFCVFSKTQYDIFKILYPNKEVKMVGMSIKNLGCSTIERPNLSAGVKLLFFGRIEYYKGLDLLIRAMEKIHSQGIRNLHLTIAGTGHFWDECKSMIKTISLYTLKIRFIQVEEIPNLMGSHHFLVLPYRDSTQSGPIMIAMNYGLPILAPRLSSFTSIYDEEASIYYDGESIDLALSYLSELSNKDYEKIANNVSKISKRFSESSIASNYINYFNTIITQYYDN